MKNSILKAVINFSFWTAISRVFGLLRDVLLAASLGAGLVSDAFFVAFKLPNMFRRLVAEGALVQSFLPTFSYVEENNSKQQAQEFASYVQSIILIVLFSSSSSTKVLSIQLSFPVSSKRYISKSNLS